MAVCRVTRRAISDVAGLKFRLLPFISLREISTIRRSLISGWTRPVTTLGDRPPEASRPKSGDAANDSQDGRLAARCQYMEKRKMATGYETAAAILVQTIFLKDGHLQGLLGEQASKSPETAAEFLRPYYAAALAMTAKA